MFPDSIPTYTPSDPNQTLDQNNHTARHTSYEDNLVALATKVGVDGSADTDSHDYKIAALGTDISNLESDKADTTAVASAIAAAKEALYPVGSIYINATDATNPGTLLGFGTWVAFGSGRVPVGFDSGDANFDTAEETGGTKTETLTTSQIPAHNHNIPGMFVNQSGSGVSLVQQSDANLVRYGTGAVGWPGSATGVTSSKRQWGIGDPSYSMNTDNKGDGGSHNNLQPYIVVYMWKRTA